MTDYRKIAQDYLEGSIFLEYLGSGIARRVLEIDENYVLKIENLKHKNEYLKERDIVKNFKITLLRRLYKQLKANLITDKSYLHFVTFTNLPVSKDSIKYYVSNINSHGSTKLQNLNESLNWDIIKNTELAHYFPKVIDHFMIGNKLIIIQEKGKNPDDIYDTALCNFRNCMIEDFKKHGYRLHDIHLNNFIEMPNGTYKMCDSGFCEFYK